MRTTQTATDPYLVTIDDPVCRDPELVGAKAANLAAMAAGGFRVPEMLVLTVTAFTSAAGGSGRDASTDRVLDVPRSVGVALSRAAAHFSGVELAVRSSGVAEDLADTSYAGQYETTLGVRGPAALVEAVRGCWASAASARVRAYRARHGTPGPAPIAVIVQRQLAPSAAGVAFTADPVTGDRSTVVIDAAAGLGDRLAAGAVTPEQWRVGPDGAPRTAHDPDVLSADQAEEIADLARSVAERAGGPQDIEWAIDADGLWLLQTRPITQLPDPVPVPVAVPDGFWQREVSHAPQPHTAFNRIFLEMQVRSAGRLGERFGMLMEGVDFREIGGLQYIRVVPLGGRDRPPPPAWLLPVLARLVPAIRRQAKRADEVIRQDLAAQLVSRWHEEWRPRLVADLQRLRAVDRAALDDRDLDRHLADALEVYFRLGDVKMDLHVAADMLTLSELAATCHSLLGWEDAEALDLVVGLSPASTAPARDLEGLVGLLARRPALRDALTAGADLDTLIQADEGFRTAFAAYLERHGHRTLRYEVAEPTFAERPDLVLRMVRDRVLRGGARDGDAHGHRARALTRARESLVGRPAAERHHFEDVLSRAERAYPVREDSGTIGFEVFAAVRLAALEVGRRLAARGQLAERDDIFHLEVAEARDALRDREPRHDLVQRRKAERRWVQAHPGPASYGRDPGPPPALTGLPRGLRRVTEAMLWGLAQITELERSGCSQHDPRSLSGVAASPGQYTGTVRVIADESEFDKLRTGDVVVCPITSPAWSVLFPAMGAVVTDTGGVLSHPAIIARECGIPAVVATGNATSLLRDGQAVTVDGSAGTVRLIGG